MKVLAVEASGSAMAMCAWQSENDQVRALLQRDESRGMSRDVMAKLDETLSRAGWEIGEVEALCVGLGPGSWTSLRIVLSMMKTLAQTREIPLAGIATFEAAAHAIGADAIGADAIGADAIGADAIGADVIGADAILTNDLLLEGSISPKAKNSARVDSNAKSEKANLENSPAENTIAASASRALLPASFALLMLAPSRANELYTRLFWSQNGALETLHWENVASPQEIAARVLATIGARAASVPLLICNLESAPQEKLGEVGEILSQNLEVRQMRVSPADIATQVARLGAEKIRSGKADNALALLPIYVAASAAERLREKNLSIAD